MRASANRDEVVKIIHDITGLSEEIARETLKLYFEPDRGVFPKQGELDLKGLGQVIQFMAETGDLKPPLPSSERFVDLSATGSKATALRPNVGAASSSGHATEMDTSASAWP